MKHKGGERMTNEEREDAIKFFNEVTEKEVNNAKYSRLAIEALEQREKTDILEKIRAEIEQEYKVESEHSYGQGLRRATEIIDKYREVSE